MTSPRLFVYKVSWLKICGVLSIKFGTHDWLNLLVWIIATLQLAPVMIIVGCNAREIYPTLAYVVMRGTQLQLPDLNLTPHTCECRITSGPCESGNMCQYRRQPMLYNPCNIYIGMYKLQGIISGNRYGYNLCP